MFSLFGGRKEYYDSRTKKRKPNAANETPTKGAVMGESGIEDSGIVIDHNQNRVPISPFGTNSYAVDDEDLVPSELSSSAYGSSYNQQQHPDTPSNDLTTTTTSQQLQQQQIPSNDTTMKVALDPKQAKQEQKLSPNNSSNGVHAISYVTQAPEHGYTAGDEDDLSTLGDESIIRRGFHKHKELLKQQAEQKKKHKNRSNKKQVPPTKSYDTTKIDKAHTRSTEEISPSNESGQSGDLPFSFSNVLDVNEKIPDASCLGYDITDHSLTDRDQNTADFEKDYREKEEADFLQRNRWTIIKFMVAISLFLLMVAAAVLVVSLLHMRSVANETEAFTMDNGGYASNGESTDDTLPPLVPVPAPTELVPPDSVFAIDATSPNDVMTTSPTSADVITTSPTSSTSIAATTIVRPWTDMPNQSQFTDAPVSAQAPTIESSIGLGDIANAADANERAKVGTDLRFVIANFSPTSLIFLEDPNSAQSKALDWMTKDPNYWNMEISTIVQRWTLAVLYYSSGGPNWQTEGFPDTYAEGKSPWLSYSDECLWESTNQGTQGRICDSDNNLFAIHLRGAGLTGTLPAELSLLSDHLRLLFVNGNELTGTLPSELGRLTALEKLNLQYNNFSGSLPSEIGTWNVLSIASLGNNQFSGQIPAETASWGSMRTIGFENNIFYGTLPKEWSNMPYLEKISIEYNLLTGTIPNEFNYMYQLTSLSMQNNDLTGEMQWGLCPGCYSVVDLKADCEEVTCECCTMCFIDSGN